MNYNISKPSKFLSQYVKQYWSLECRIPDGKNHLQRIVPSGLFELIFYLNGNPKATDNKKAINDNIIITGQIKNHHDLIISGNLSLFAIYFEPHGLSMFLDMPVKELFNQSVPLRHIIKDTVSKLEDELYEATTFKEQIRIAEIFLESQLQKNEKAYRYERIRHTVNQINQARGVVEIKDLVSETFLSRKQFERTFAEIIGTTPKQFLKIVRFQNAIYERSQNPKLSFTEIAYKCGYFDQAHMINDFKTLSGANPKQFFAEEGAFSDYFND
ncbi:MAG: AraC family transcriptional regulator [Bacteroidetes bacterium]|nr:AraC family transcriptional regulator [Bacteroidota bacterium]